MSHFAVDAEVYPAGRERVWSSYICLDIKLVLLQYY
jgi:hypothetical protein